ncbi:L,D-transpeptidase [Priestia taiwanensis]|uniref:L,D-TPase catalytic domain-containing protein n=1 Tax=Priestia taiwanensis TaxID=1347902 RepID=A0A917EPI1_9BACI|nr:L,D-transpeptidase [Priestia taiwanensis]MBM7363041.1 lipoprotein-anchoring transpeptidase ErfK/SrfK [Priestia taiwanensis]GGE67130.1 hypothetical protein GCM10007140_16620 [Priestia taiwanensis]
MEEEKLSRAQHRRKRKKVFIPILLLLTLIVGVVAFTAMSSQFTTYAAPKKAQTILYKEKNKQYDAQAVQSLAKNKQENIQPVAKNKQDETKNVQSVTKNKQDETKTAKPAAKNKQDDAKAVEGNVPQQLLIVSRKQNKLYFYENGKLARTFSVATGKSSTQTPDGVFPIVNKIKNRPYYTKNIPGGDPRNPLGDRWMGLDVNGTKGTTYAIHGNNNPAAIGRYTTLGCVRMHNKDIHWLFDRLQVGTKVIVTNSKEPIETVALAKGFKLYAAK